MTTQYVKLIRHLLQACDDADLSDTHRLNALLSAARTMVVWVYPDVPGIRERDNDAVRDEQLLRHLRDMVSSCRQTEASETKP